MSGGLVGTRRPGEGGRASRVTQGDRPLGRGVRLPGPCRPPQVAGLAGRAHAHARASGRHLRAPCAAGPEPGLWRALTRPSPCRWAAS